MKISHALRVLVVPASLALAAVGPAASAADPPGHVAGKLVQLNDNGAWSWFMDERAVVNGGKLVVGSVRSVGRFDSGRDDPDWGNVEVAVLDIASGATDRVVLDRHFEQDDHDNPAFLVMPDNRYLAVYTRHGVDRKIYTRVSEPGNPLAWGPASAFETPARDNPASRGDTVTYSNLFRTPAGRYYDFHRGFHHDPNDLVSDDPKRGWEYGGHLFTGRGGYSPYLKYAFDGNDTLHFIATDDHPRNYDNSIYHGYLRLREGVFYLSDGTRRGDLSKSTDTNLAAWDFTRVFQGDPDNVGWVTDLELDREGRPYLVFTVQKDGRGLRPGRGGMDHRFHYGRWDGSAWQVQEIAFAGSRLYPGEDDYTGLASLDPNDPGTVYISTNADPLTGAPLMSSADGKRHHELFRGTRRGPGKAWRWEPITADSAVDNLRPVVPKWKEPRTALVWMRGTYKSNHGEWTTAVVATILPPASEK